MNLPCRMRTLLPAAWLVFAFLVIPARVSGQAWLPEKGEGSFSVAYEFIAFQGHYRADGSKDSMPGASRTQSAIFAIEYGVTSKLALDVSLPIIASRYADTSPPPAFLRSLYTQALQALGPSYYNKPFLDDLTYNATVQDFHVTARYNVLAKPVVLTPFMTVVIPSHDYAYVGESSPGRHLKEVQWGVNAGRRLNPVLPNAYAHAQFAFAVPEETLGLRMYRINTALEGGYFLTRWLSVRGMGAWQHTFDGLRLQDLNTPERLLTHDRLLKASYWHAGGGTSFGVSHSMAVSADVVTFLSGSNTHYGTGFSVGLTGTFTARRRARTSASASFARPMAATGSTDR